MFKTHKKTDESTEIYLKNNSVLSFHIRFYHNAKAMVSFYCLTSKEFWIFKRLRFEPNSILKVYKSWGSFANGILFVHKYIELWGENLVSALSKDRWF